MGLRFPRGVSGRVGVSVEKRRPGQNLDSREPVELPEVMVVGDYRIGPDGQRTFEDGVVVIVGRRVHRHRGFDHPGEVHDLFDRDSPSPVREWELVVVEDGHELPEERGRHRRLDGTGLGHRDAGGWLLRESEFRHEDVGVEDDGPSGHDGK